MSEHSAYSKENFHKVVAESNAARRPKSNQSVPSSFSSGAPPLKRQKKQARFDGKTPDHYLFDSEEHERGNRQEAQVTDSSSDDESSKILSICATGHKVAAVLFEQATTNIYVMEDTTDSSHFDQVYLVLEQLRPDLIIASLKSKDALVNRINEYCQSYPAASFQLTDNKLFQLNTAKSHLASIRLPVASAASLGLASSPSSSRTSMTLNPSQSQASYDDIDSLGMGRVRIAMMKLGCWVNVDAPLAISAMGALIAQIQQQRAFGALPGDDTRVVVASVESLSLDQHMYINQDTLNSLEIFQAEAHASLQSSKTKQGVSLFGILDTTQTIAGHQLLERWFLRPLTSIEEIGRRHDAIALFASHDNLGTVALIRRALKKANKAPMSLDRIKKGTGGLHEWWTVTDSFSATVQVKNMLPDLISAKKPLKEYPILVNLNMSVTEKLQELLHEIMSQIDWQLSSEAGRVSYLGGVDAELDDLKEKWAGLQPTLAHLARQIALSIVPGYCRDLNVVCFPQLGYLLACTLEHPDAYNINVPDGWDLQFFSDLFYFKDEHMRDLDATFGDLHSKIVDREIDLTQELTQLILVVEADIVQTMNFVAELDCLLALSQAVDTYSLSRPQMTNDNVLRIKGGRHLVQECIVSLYVPNDVALGGANGKSMLVMSGANGSGKTAYGKMVALIVYMSQVGCFVPAESSTIGVRTAILTCLNARESVSLLSSSFMLQLRQISMTLRLATDSSLILVDELGKGTLPRDGTSLLVGVLCNLLQRKAIAIVITHFRPPMLPLEEIQQAHMQSIDADNHGTYGISFLYQCQPGPSYSSHAGACAMQYGIPLDIVRRAHEASIAIAAHDLYFDTLLTMKEQARLRKADAVVRAFLLLDLSKEEDLMERIKSLLK